MSPSDFLVIPFDEWVTAFVRGWLVPNFRPFFRAVQVPITQVLNGLDAFFAFMPMLAMTAAFALLALKFAGRGMAIFTVAGFIGLVVTIIAFNSRYYRQLSAAYAKAPDEPENDPPPVPAT